LLIIVGASIGLFSSIMGALFQFYLQLKKQKYQWAHDIQMRKEQWLRDDIDNIGNLIGTNAYVKNPTILKNPHGEYCFTNNTHISLGDSQIIPIEKSKVGNTLLAFDVYEKLYKKVTVKEIIEEYTSEYIILNNSLEITGSH